jgi:GntR family transcriptional repressor for pyruvate dehydrogenase complex
MRSACYAGFCALRAPSRRQRGSLVAVRTLPSKLVAMTVEDLEVHEFKVRQVVRARAQVEQQLKEAILRGQFAQGEKLPPETELARQFGVSRPTVREALRALVTAGLIRKISGVSGGSFVNTVNPDSLGQMLRESMSTTLRLGTLNIGELTDVRKVLEIPSARLAAQYRSPEQLAELRAIVEKQRTTTLDDPEIPNYDAAFHTLIGQASNNRLLAALVAAAHAVTHPVEYLEVTPEVARKTVKQHLAIVAALDAGDQARAAAAMEVHLDYVLRHSAKYPKYAASGSAAH